MNSNFSPNRIKFLLEQNGYGRVTDTKLAEMLNRKKHNIAMWKNKSPDLLDRINDVCVKYDFTFYELMEVPNKNLVVLLGKHPLIAYQWEKKKPKLILDLINFFGTTGLTFEMIYKNDFKN